MDTIVSITNSRETELQFDISVEGVDVSTMEARFVIEADGVQYAFECKQGDEAAKWVVKIPAMPHLKHGEYKFHIEIITNGYYFNPYRGKVKVTPEPTVARSEVKNDKPPTPVVKISQPEVKKEKSVPVVAEEEEPVPGDLLDAFMKSVQDKPRHVDTAQDKAVKEALKNFSAKPLDVKLPPVAPVSKPVKPSTVPPKQRAVESNEPRRSNLESVIEKIGVPTDERSKKVLDIINSVDKGTE